MHGVYSEDIKELDGLSAQYRRMYFLRNLMRSQMELSGAIQVLLGTPEFKNLLEKQSTEVKKKFTEAASVLTRVHPLLKDVRNDIGGHVLLSAVQAALERMDWHSFDFLDIGPLANLTHYKFAAELVAEMLLKDVSAEERRTITSSKFASTVLHYMRRIGDFCHYAVSNEERRTGAFCNAFFA
jgi:hypothetical protein